VKEEGTAALIWGRSPIAAGRGRRDAPGDGESSRDRSPETSLKVSSAISLPRGRLLQFLGEMLVIRRFEEKLIERFRAGELAGFLHACIGQEATAVGVCRALRDGDLMASTHRAHGHVIANGTPPNEVMAELYGKVEGCSHGYGGSMHLYDVKRGAMGANAVVGGGLPAAVGAALAFNMRNEPRVSLAFFGDGATNIGTFHESMNLAQLWQLPVVFVCENNHWSESTPQAQHQPIRDLTERAAAYGMHALHVDGQDVEAVHLAAVEALEFARSGHGPAFLLCETERLDGHYIGDAQVYRDKEELRRLRATRDPIRNLRERLEVTDDEWGRLDAEAQRVADESVEFAKAGTDPDPADALKYVYAPES
jgi:acetoin:2,6-dichlorophenolindophenol oxidoreductase subunit alpha